MRALGVYREQPRDPMPGVPEPVPSPGPAPVPAPGSDARVRY